MFFFPCVFPPRTFVFFPATLLCKSSPIVIRVKDWPPPPSCFRRSGFFFVFFHILFSLFSPNPSTTGLPQLPFSFAHSSHPRRSRHHSDPLDNIFFRGCFPLVTFIKSGAGASLAGVVFLWGASRSLATTKSPPSVPLSFSLKLSSHVPQEAELFFRRLRNSSFEVTLPAFDRAPFFFQFSPRAACLVRGHSKT